MKMLRRMSGVIRENIIETNMWEVELVKHR
jgi:hypothetical protein